MARTRRELPVVSAERRAEIASRPPEPDVHEALLGELDFLDDVELVPPPDGARAPEAEARVVAWNAERGRALDAAAALLGAQRPDWLLLTELDRGMARSGQLHTARELAARLGCGYAFGIEFLELGLGDERERAQHAGERNAVGQHGAAILSPHPLRDPELVRLERSGRWFDGELGERRVGGRMALVATVELAGANVTLATVHLESHSDPDERCAELAVLLDAIERRAPPGSPAVIGGDLNTSSLAREEWTDREQLERALARSPGRLAEPVPHEPLFLLCERHGYDWRACNRLDVSTHRTRSGRGTLHLDWLLVRGLAARDAEVVAAVDPATGTPLSDHELLAATLTPVAQGEVA